MSITRLETALDAIEGRITKTGADTRELKKYLRSSWNDQRVSDSLRHGILAKLQGFRLGRRHSLNFEAYDVPSLYDLLGLNNMSINPEVWPVKIPRRLLYEVLKSLVRRIEKTAACVKSEEEVQRSEFYQDWYTYPPWAQVECVGYTLSRIQRVWEVKDALWRDGVKRVNRGSENARRIENACPKLEVYAKIVQNQDPISFHQALLKLSSLSSPSNEDSTDPSRPDPRSFTHNTNSRSRSPQRRSQSPLRRFRSPFRATSRPTIPVDEQQVHVVDRPTSSQASPTPRGFVPLQEGTRDAQAGGDGWMNLINF